ncbi:MAG TPA: biotin carboxylase N-terminal domain-containing protein [Actinomycetes bacterium]
MTPPPAVLPAVPLTRLLVANRGEVARRVFRTAHELGLATVAVYSDPDAGEPFVREADTAIRLPGTAAAETYLDAAAVIAAAHRAGADAVHPGYGFLAENADFARAVLDAGLVWVGPTPESIRALGSKVAAKRLAAEAGVPLAPSAELTTDDPAAWAAAGAEVGFPLLVKASAGGGGKGMRLVGTAAGLVDAIEGSRREAASAFGDPTVFLERYLAGARHVEVQVVGDTHGTVTHLFERECSIQRRHQKIVEESPSPGTTPATLARMLEAAVALARAVDYVGVGTVEFLVAGAGEAQEFFFLEMNTRLQVEHPVTEETTLEDLVALQLAVAQGRPLPASLLAPTRSGHAIEVRLYAEDPAAGFLPSTGRLLLLEPAGDPQVRWESGVETGSVVSPYYDPMLAKVIVAAETREQAARVLARELRRTRIHGLRTNRDSLVAILESAAFLAGETPTDFLDRQPGLLDPAVPDDVRRAHLVAATLHGVRRARAAAPLLRFAPAGWRNVPAVRPSVSLGVGGQPVQVTYLERPDGTATVGIDGTDHEARVVGAGDDWIDLELGGLRHRHRVAHHGGLVCVDGGGWASELPVLPRFADHSGEAAAQGPAAPVPGTITVVAVAAGDRVAAGQLLVVLEAMKMEHRIIADADAVVAEVPVAVGDSVDAHQVVVVLEAVRADGQAEGDVDA